MGDTDSGVTQTLEAPTPAVRPRARRRRWPWILAIVVAAVVLGLRMLWAAGYAPLVTTGMQPDVGMAYVDDSTPDTAALDAPRYQLPFVPGQEHTMILQVINTGSAPIVVLGGVPDPALPLMPLGVAAVGALQDDEVGGLPWPQTVEPGHTLKLAVVLRIGSCHSSGNGVTATMGSVSLRTRTMWFERQADLALLTPVATTVDQSHCTG